MIDIHTLISIITLIQNTHKILQIIHNIIIYND